MKYDFAVLIPYYGNRIPRHIECVEALDKLGVPLVVMQDQPYLDIARSELVCKARRELPNIKAVCFIDHDMIFPDPQTVIGMMRRMIESNMHMVGAGYALRRPGAMVSCFPIESKAITFYKAGYEPARWVGTGFTGINVGVFEALDKVMPKLYCTSTRRDFVPYFERYIKNDTYYPDDVGFCYRIRDMGMRVWIDTEPRVFHRGAYDYALEDAGYTVPNHTELTINFDGKGE